MTGLAADFARALDPTLIARDVGLDQLDEWQARLVDEPPKRLLCCCGRQVGKSTAAAVCALNAAIYQAPATVIMVSPSQRQSIELYRAFHSMYSRLPGRPSAQYETMTRLELENGSRIISLPGSERTIRGLASVDLIVLDEAARVEDELLAAIRPMLAVSNGSLFALSTPAGKRGWFYEQWLRGIGWHRISIKSTECPRIDREFLEQEREALGPLLFGQEYLCEFHDAENAAFLSELIDAAFVGSFEPFLTGPQP
jgi:Terminase large subunit, T4likevirus-type, N-terminal